MKRNAHSSRIVAIAIVIVAIVAVVYALSILRANTDSEVEETLNLNLIEQRTSSPENLRIADDKIPATNRWFSSLIFGDDPVVFAYPFSFKASSNGFELSVPKVTSSEDAVFASHTPDISVDLGAERYEVREYDDVTVTNSFQSRSGESIADVLLVQGHPFVYVTARSNFDMTISGNGIRDFKERDSRNVLLFRVNDQQYGLRADTVSIDGEGAIVTFKSGQTAAMFAIPDDANTNDFITASEVEVTGSNVEYDVKSSAISTTINLRTKNNAETIIGKLPHHGSSTGSNQMGSFNTLYGELTLQKGNEITYETTQEIPRKKLDLSTLSADRKTELKEYLKTETDTLTLDKTDTYFGFKELYRASQLLLLADELDANEQKGQIQSQLSNALTAWLKESDGRSERLFYYDDTLKGVVGIQPSFGSEEFNDHHFHYGYFIYAASVLADYDNSFVEEYGEVINLIVSDIAAENINDLPDVRSYDRFTGHSWASGFSNFADGNNQESSSEAINAWAAVYYWAESSNNDELRDRALWLYGNEINATQNYWLNDQRSQPGFQSYDHPFVSIVWNGKRDYTTFFSPRPQAILGIQLIPMSPAHTYLSGSAVAQNLNHVLPDTDNYSGQFGDYLLMYKAMDDPADAVRLLPTIADDQIDDGNSKTYLYAWIYSFDSAAE